MRKNQLTNLLFFLALIVSTASLLTSTASAQKTQTARISVTAPAPAAAVKVSPLMWAATDANGRRVYLFGSIHLGSKDFYPLPSEIENAFAQSKKLIVEVDLGKVDQTAMQSFVLSNGLYAGEDSLFKHLSPAATEKLKKFAADNTLPIDTFTKLKPWMAAITIAIVPLLKSGYQQEFGIDKYFLDKAKDKKSIAEVESVDWQLKLFSETPEPQQVKYLEATLNQVENFKTYTQDLMAAWKAGDVKRLESFFNSDFGEATELQKKIIDDRNPRMADFAEQCLKNNESCFIVVGAGHLIGTSGVAQLLKNRGYKVEQVQITPNGRN